MSESVLRELSSKDAQSLLQQVSYSGVSYKSLKTLRPTENLYLQIEKVVEFRLLQSAHSFRITSLEFVSVPNSRLTEFKRRMSRGNVHFLFHGSKEANHESIFNQGFLIDEEHFGDTDKGYIGKGVYFSPHPEYSAAYIKDTPGISRWEYANPVKIGTTCKLLGCIVVVGHTRRKFMKEYGSTIPTDVDSHWAWVEKDGSIAADDTKRFAVEYSVREPIHCCPRFRISLKRVTREVIWVDPNINNSENSGHVQRLKQTDGFFLYATTSTTDAIVSLQKKKEGIEYRAITAGRCGEEFVQSLREIGIDCSVLVFCMSVDYHKTWAVHYSNVSVTKATQKLYDFATWK